MKKLIATMAAIVTGFAAWAALPSSTTFEGSGEFSDGALVVDGTTWSTNGAPTLTQATYGSSAEAYQYSNVNARYADFSGENTAYLNIKTTFGQPLERLNDVTVAADTPVYFDQLVKFTAADEEPNLELYTGEKLVIYALDKSELETGATPATNLMVVAGRRAGSELSSATYDFGNIDVDAWHRLTIKAIKAYNNSELGFEIFLDGVALSYAGTDKAYDATAVASLPTGAAALNQAQKIVASLVSSTLTITAVGFDGQGAIDDVMATTTSPGTWADDKNVTLNWTPATLTALSYAAHGQTTTLDATGLAAGSAAIPYMADMTIAVTPRFASNWAFDRFVVTGGWDDGMTLHITADDASATLVAKDVTPRIEYVVGDTTNYYPTFAAALADVSSGTLKLKMPVSVGLNGALTEGTIGSGANITIDLNGQTITGVATDFPGFVFNVLGGSLTIMDSSGDNSGRVVMGSGTMYAGVVNVGSLDNDHIGTLAISGGTLEGAVVVDPGDPDPTEGYPAGEASLTGGKYKYAANTTSDAFTLAGFVAEGYAAAKDVAEAPAYWVVSALPKATVTLTYESSKVSVSGVANGDQVAVGSTITVTATPETGYENAVITINDVVQSSYTVTQADVSGGVTISVAVTATEWTITYYDGESVFATDTYTMDNRDSKALNAGTKPGYTFGEWLDVESGNSVSSLVGQTGPLELIGVWTPAPTSDHTVTINWSTAPVGNPFIGVKYNINMGTPVDATSGVSFTVPDGAKLNIAPEMADWYKYTGGTADGGDTINADATYNLEGVALAPADFTGDTAAEAATKAGITSATLIAGGKDAVVKAVTWAEANHVPTATVNEMVFEGNDANTQAEKAYLFNTNNTAEAVAAAEANFKFLSISPGTAVPSIPTASTYNGTVTVKGCDTVNGTYVAPATTSHKFYKAELLLPTAD